MFVNYLAKPELVSSWGVSVEFLLSCLRNTYRNNATLRPCRGFPFLKLADHWVSSLKCGWALRLEAMAIRPQVQKVQAKTRSETKKTLSKQIYTKPWRAGISRVVTTPQRRKETQRSASKCGHQNQCLLPEHTAKGSSVKNTIPRNNLILHNYYTQLCRDTMIACVYIPTILHEYTDKQND